jgi:hypothetical protein
MRGSSGLSQLRTIIVMSVKVFYTMSQLINEIEAVYTHIPGVDLGNIIGRKGKEKRWKENKNFPQK